MAAMQESTIHSANRDPFGYVSSDDFELASKPEQFHDMVVQLRDVSKSFVRGSTRTVVLDACQLDVQSGECVYLMGPSGSGKTTLLSIIGCVLRPDSGTVHVLGADVARMSPQETAALRRKELGFVFQRFQLIRGLSALENVCVPLLLEGVRRHDAERRGQELLVRVGLEEKADSQIRELSVGQCQRVALARALVADPPLLLADEPTAALDAESGQQAMRLLRNLTVEMGKTAIVVTHDPRIEAFADRILRMESGCLRKN